MKFECLFMSAFFLLTLPISYSLTVPSDISLTIQHGTTLQSNFTYDSNTTPTISQNSIFPIIITPYYASKSVAFSISVPLYFNSGNYLSQLFVSGDNETKTINISVVVPNNSSFLIPERLSLTLNDSSYGFFFVNVINTGNTILPVYISSPLSYLNSFNITTYPNSNFSMPVFYNIPETLIPKLYEFNLTANDKTLPIKLTIQDKNPPKIISSEYEKYIRAVYSYPIKIKAEDNINISSVWVTILGNISFLSKSGDYYVGEISSTSLGNWSFSVYTNDTSGNQIAKVENINVDKRGNCNFYEFNSYSIANSTEFEQTIFKGERTKMDVSISSFTFTTASGEEINSTFYQLYVLGDNQKFQIGSAPTNLDVEELKLGIYSDEFGFFSGELVISIPNWICDSKSVKFSGRVSVITVPISYTDWIGDYESNCNANYTGTIENSSYTCCTKYPIDIELDKLGILVTKREYNAIEDKWKIKIDNITSQLDKVTLIMWILIIMFVLSCIFILYITKYKGKIYRKWW